MEVRASDGTGPLLFEWDSDTRTIDLIRKDKYYKVQLDDHSYCVLKECSKYDCKRARNLNSTK